MKQLLHTIRRPFVWLLVTMVYGLGCLCYDKKYLTGRYFDRWHFSTGWEWVLRDWFRQKVLGQNGHVPWPVPPWVHIGAPRNIVFDPDEEWTIDPEQFASKARNTPFAGRRVKGKVKYTIVKGEVIYRDGV